MIGIPLGFIISAVRCGKVIASKIKHGFKLRQERNMPPRKGWEIGWREWLHRLHSCRSFRTERDCVRRTSRSAGMHCGFRPIGINPFLPYLLPDRSRSLGKWKRKTSVVWKEQTMRLPSQSETAPAGRHVCRILDGIEFELRQERNQVGRGYRRVRAKAKARLTTAREDIRPTDDVAPPAVEIK